MSTTRPSVEVDPGRCSGDPTLGGHRLPTATVARYYSSLGVEETRRAYVIESDDILVCCWFEARYGGRRFKKGWRNWLAEHQDALWQGEWDDIPFPPMLDASP